MNYSATTITLHKVYPHETIGDLTKRACLQGKIFQVSITVQEPTVKYSHPLANYLGNNHPFSGLSERLNKANNDIRESMNKNLFDKFEN
jgi:hypothetical protein